MKRFTLLLTGIFFLVATINAHNAELFGVIGNQLFSVNHETAATQKVVDIDLPSGVSIRDLTYHPEEKAFFSFVRFTSSPRLVSFSWDGSYRDIGPLHLNGRPVSMIEAIDYNEADEYIYASVSMNGADKYTETIVRVDIETAACTSVASLNAIGRDADDIAFWSGSLYISDGIPGNGVSRMYACRMPEEGTARMSAQRIKQTTYRPISDLSAMDGFIYGTDKDYQLIRYALDGRDAVVIGKTHVPDPRLKEKRMVGLATVKIIFAK